MLTAPLLTMPVVILAADCNRNGTEDLLDLSAPVMDFRQGRTLPAGFAPWLFPFDLDGDGDADLAAHDAEARQIVLFENRGGADLAEKARIDGLQEARSVAGGDLDGDGDPEFAIATRLAVRVLWDDGGTHVRETRVAVAADPWRILAGDLDQDGDLDLITANFLPESSVDDSVSIINNGGAGGFEDPRDFVTQKGATVLAAGDVDGDGDLDIVVARYESTQLVVLVNRGSLDLVRAQERPELPGFPAQYLVSADLEGNGIDELLVTGYTSGILVLSKKLGEALPTVREKIDLAPWDRAWVLPIDIDGDRAMDLIVPGYGCPDFQVLLGNGRGHFVALPPLRAGLRVNTLAAADWDGNGALDLAGSGYSSGISLFLQGAASRSKDCNQNGVPDECDPDCNQNGIPDDCDLSSGASADCDRNSIPDECDPDCDSNDMPDVCDIGSGNASDCDRNSVPDSCELAGRDRDGNGLLDDCEIENGASADCNRNGIPDPVDLKPSFSLPYEECAVGGFPTTVVFADLDGDGGLEVATGDHDRGGISVVENLPDGSLGVRSAGSLGTYLFGLAVLDADADGDLDLAAALQDPICGSSRGWVALIRNVGDQRFARGPAYPVEPVIRFLAVGHLDQDGVEDLIASSVELNSHPEGVSWWLRGKGDGAFELPVRIAERGGPLAVADLDRDGDDDLAFASGRLILARGDGGFVDAGPLPIQGQSIGAVDLDGNGSIDLLAPGPNGHRLAMNRGDRTFEMKDLSIQNIAGQQMLIADLQGDGRPDIAAPSLFYRPALSVFLNRGDASFEPETPITLMQLPYSLAAGDVDGDGDVDITGVFPWAGSALVLRNLGDGTFRTRATYALGRAPRSIEAIDLDGDRDLDIAGIPWNESSLLFYENDGRASYVLKRTIDLDRQPFALRAAELNGDGRPDLVMKEFMGGTETCGISIFFNRGPWEFEKGPRLTTGSYSEGLAAGDLDGDGDQDLLTLNPDSHDVGIFWNDAGAFGRSTELGVDQYPQLLLTVRLDGDGLTDLIIGREGELRVFRNAGAGRFERGEALSVRDAPEAAVTGDMDQDGDNDLVFGVIREAPCLMPRRNCGVEFGVAFNAGDGTWERVERYPAGFGNLALSLSDLDRDGDLDVIAAIQLEDFDSESALAVLLNAGDGSLTETRRMTNGGFRSLAAEDLNGDRTPDIFWVDGGSISVLLGRGRSPASLDSDGDGLPDECRAGVFRRGDADGTGGIELTDAVLVLGHLFLGSRDAGFCPDGADADDNGVLELTDAIRILDYLFLSGEPPAPPGPQTCGEDPTADPLPLCVGAGC